MTNDKHNEDDRARDRESDEEWVDALGRKAGGAFRKPAPPRGIDDLQRRTTQMKRKRAGAGIGAIAALAVTVLVAANLGGEDDSDPITADSVPEVTSSVAATNVAPSSTTPATTTPDPTTTGTTAPDISPEVQWALDYTGGAPGPATGTPVRIGATHNRALGSDWWNVAAAAASFVNTELGGIQGHPVELVPCVQTTGDEATTCGATFAADAGMKMVLAGEVDLPFYSAIGATKAMVVGFEALTGVVTPQGSPVDQVPGFVYLQEGGAGFYNLVAFLANGLPEPVDEITIVGPVVSFFDGDSFQSSSIVAGKTVHLVDVPDTASPQDVVDALRSANADDAGVIAVFGISGEYCRNFPTAMELLGGTRQVLVPDTCAIGPEAEASLSTQGVDGPMPDGWYLHTSGYNPFEPDLESGWRTYVSKVEQYTPDASRLAWLTTGTASDAFVDLLALVKLSNDAGPIESVDVSTLRRAVADFRGPVMLQAGELACGAVPLLAVSIPMICAGHMGVLRYVDGAWISVGSGLDGRPIGMDGRPAA